MTQVATLQTNMKMDATDFNKNMEKATKVTKDLGLMFADMSTKMDSYSDNFKAVGVSSKSVATNMGKAVNALMKVSKESEKVGDASKMLDTNMEKLGKTLEETEKHSQGTATAFKEIVSDMGKLQRESKEGAKEVGKLDDKTKLLTTNAGKLSDKTKSLAIEIKKMVKEIKTATTQMNRFGQSITNINNKANQLRTTTRNIGRNFEQLGRSAQAISTDMTNIGRQMNVVNTSARRLRSTVTQTGSAFNQLASGVNNANNAINQVANSANQAEDDLGGLAEGLATAISAPLAGVGLGAGKMASDLESANARISASLGKVKVETEDTLEVVKGVYSGGWGDSLEEVAQATSRVSQAMKSITPDELEGVTKKAMMLAQIMEEDVAIVAKSANQLMEQFGLTSEETFDILTKGYQSNLNFSDDYLDTLNEYAPYFSKLGFDAQGMFDILVSGSENGAFMLDKVGDAFKEFGIRSKDASALSMQAFNDLGFEDAQKMTDMFASGGEKAQQAYALVVDALNGVNDATKKNEIGVALFGTQFEDLEDKTMHAMLNATSSLEEFGGSAKEAMKMFEESFGQQLISSLRQVGMALEPLGKILLNMATIALPPLIVSVTLLSDLFASLPAPIQTAVTVLGGIAMVVPVVILLGNAMKGTAIATSLATVATQAYNTQMGATVVLSATANASMVKLGTTIGAMTSLQGWSILASGATYATGWGKLTGVFTGLLGIIKKVGMAMLTFIASPVGIVLATIGAVVGALYLYKNKQEEINKVEERSKKTWEEIKALREGVYNGDAEYIESLESENKKIEGLAKRLELFHKNLAKEDKGDKAFWNPFGDTMKAYEELEKEAHDMGYNLEELSQKYNANTEAVKKNAEWLVRQDDLMGGLNDKKQKDIQTQTDQIKSQQSYGDNIKKHVENYYDLLAVEEKSTDQKNSMINSMNYLWTTLGDGVTQFDKNGNAVGLYEDKIRSLVKEIDNMSKVKLQTFQLDMKTQLADLNKQISELDSLQKSLADNDMSKATRQENGKWVAWEDSSLGNKNLERLKQQRSELAKTLNDVMNPITNTVDTSSSSTSTEKTAEEILQERIQNELDAVNYQKDMGKLSVQQEHDRLKKILAMTKVNTKEREQLDVMVYQKKQEIMEKSYSDELALIDFNNSMGKYSTEQYLKQIEALYKKHNTFLKSNIDEQRSMQIKMYELNLELQNKQLEKFRDNLEKANDVEQEQLRSRKEYLDEAHEQAVERIEEERDAKIKAYQDQIDAINKANDKEERDREVANAKRMLAQYEDSLTQSGQDRANELRKIIRDASATEAQEQVDMVIKAEEDRAEGEIAKINAKYEHDSKLLEQQEGVLDKVYTQMEERAETYSAKYTELYGKSQESIQKMLEEGITTEMKTKVDTTTKGFIEVNNAFKTGIDNMVASAKKAFENVSLGGVNLNPSQSATTSGNMTIVNFNAGGITIGSQADADYFFKEFATKINNIR